VTADMLAAALAYAEIGWPVFPCTPNGKVPIVAHGFKSATTDAGTITAWWARCPAANVAVATGAPGPDVLDVDVKDGRPGMALFDRARAAGLLHGAAAIVRTPSGGLHLWFAGTGQHGGAVGTGRAVELKAAGGYVLLPPSYVVDTEHGYAGRYELMERRDTVGVVDFGAVRRLLAPPPLAVPRARRGGRRGHDALVRWFGQQTNGNRNSGLFWAACCALETGAGNDILADLVDVAVTAGLTTYAAERTIASARTRVGVR